MKTVRRPVYRHKSPSVADPTIWRFVATWNGLALSLRRCLGDNAATLGGL
jgi:hypothetical protein